MVDGEKTVSCTYVERTVDIFSFICCIFLFQSKISIKMSIGYTSTQIKSIQPTTQKKYIFSSQASLNELFSMFFYSPF